jgi:hypothetical protein
MTRAILDHPDYEQRKIGTLAKYCLITDAVTELGL